jgi:hypothetical protein
LKHHAGSEKYLHGIAIHKVSQRGEEDLHGHVSSIRRSLQKKLHVSVSEERIEKEPPISSPRGISSLVAAGVPYSPSFDGSQHYNVSRVFIFISKTN